MLRRVGMPLGRITALRCSSVPSPGRGCRPRGPPQTQRGTHALIHGAIRCPRRCDLGPIVPYLAVMNDRSGQGQFQCVVTPWRPVCADESTPLPPASFRHGPGTTGAAGTVELRRLTAAHAPATSRRDRVIDLARSRCLPCRLSTVVALYRVRGQASKPPPCCWPPVTKALASHKDALAAQVTVTVPLPISHQPDRLGEGRAIAASASRVRSSFAKHPAGRFGGGFDFIVSSARGKTSPATSTG